MSADETGLRRALSLTMGFCERQGLVGPVADRLAIVLEEWIANLIEHGQAPSGSRFGLSLSMRVAHVRIVITDAGRPFDPRQARFDGPNLDRGGGVGLELIRTWCRITSYRHRGGRNRLVLEMLA